MSDTPPHATIDSLEVGYELIEEMEQTQTIAELESADDDSRTEGEAT